MFSFATLFILIMRKIVYILTLLFLASCADEQPVSFESGEDVVGNDILECRMDAAVIVDDSTGQKPVETTRTSLNGCNVPVWNSGDAISVLAEGGARSKFILVDGASTATGRFRGSLPDVGGDLCAIFPYTQEASLGGGQVSFFVSQEQSCVSGNIAPQGNVMVATFAEGQLTSSFKNVFGLLEVPLKGDAIVTRVSLTSRNQSDKLWGSFVLRMDGQQGTGSQNLQAVSGSNEVSITFKPAIQLSASSATPFYFVVPPGTLASGFTVKVYDADDNLLFTKETTKSQTIARSTIKLMPEVSGVNKPPFSAAVPTPTLWSAYNNLGGVNYSRPAGDATVIDPQSQTYRSKVSNRYAGIFYFIWHDGYQTMGGPYDNQAALGAGNYDYNNNINYGTEINSGKPHHWGQSYLGYYSATDEWVIRKHAQMLVDAGIDFIAFDMTNHKFFETEVKNLCRIYKEMRDEGNRTPQITFMVWHSKGDSSDDTKSYSDLNHDWAVRYLYRTFYTISDYSDLWFQWDGKPLMLARGQDVTNNTIKSYFTFRESWFIWNNQAQTEQDKGDPWWGNSNGNGKWPWAVCYTDNNNNPMRAGKSPSGTVEFCSVAPATHPVSNLGRSYPVGQEITYNSGSYTKTPAAGIYFKSQFNAAKTLLDDAGTASPQIMFFTGWNEWMAGHFTKGAGWLNFHHMCGFPNPEHLFVDNFNHEYSRDIEPLNGDFGDNYYYYMADFIRQFKGVDATTTYNERTSITIDGNFSDWYMVKSCYADDKGDVVHRNAKGYNNCTTYTNNTGRNDLRVSMIANNGTDLYFYVDAKDALEGYSSGLKGLNLYIKTGTEGAGWEGFNYRLMPTGSSTAKLYRHSGTGYSWTEVGNVKIAVSGKAMEVAIPLSSLGLSGSADNFTVDFKWVDNVDLSLADGIQQCMRDGDSAPNGRFRYRYVFKIN